MLQSKKLELRRSNIREEIAVLAGKESRDENENRALDNLETEYGDNERSYRGFLVSEDSERTAAGEELEGRSDQEFSQLIDAFELRQVCLALDEGAVLSGQTAEVVTELRSQNGFQGVPVPWEALEQRAGETVAPGTPDPRVTKGIIDRLFPASVAARMGAQMINVTSGEVEWPVATAGVTASWAGTETGDVAVPTVYTTIDRAMTPSNTLGAQMQITRKSMKQSGAALEQAIRRDLAAAIGAELDKAAFLGTGASGEPLGLIPGQATYGFATIAVDAAADYAAFRTEATKFLIRNAVGDYKSINLLMRPELLDGLDDIIFETGGGITELDRLVGKFKSLTTSSNALAAPTGSPLASTAVMTCTSNGVNPFVIGTWNSIDVIRDVYTKASSGQLLLTGLVTADVTASRAEQVTILTGLE
jgi:HK97 family phage major capsid protein